MARSTISAALENSDRVKACALRLRLMRRNSHQEPTAKRVVYRIAPGSDSPSKCPRSLGILNAAFQLYILLQLTFLPRKSLPFIERAVRLNETHRNPSQTARRSLWFLYGVHWILGESKDGMACSHQGSIRT